MADHNNITYFAETDARNKKVKFGIKAKDRLRHTYIVGKTGVGKSTLLENMAIQDIQNGEGMAYIDPHGGTAEKLLDYIPEHRMKDVLYFAPFDMEYPISFNVIEDIGADKRHLVVNGLMSTFEKIWADAWSARMSYILQYTIIALLEYPGATLLGINRMLSDKEYRKKVVDNLKDPSARSFWIDEFGKYTERFAAEATPAIQNKVGQFTSNPLVRNLIGQSRSSFDIRKMMDDKKIMIINLSKGRVGEGNANLIGAMLITKIYLAAMSRADKSESELSKLPNFYLYVDEFQSFANKSFADILSEARKYKLSLNIAHQYIEQMEEEVRDAVFGNVGTMITFRVGAFDAEVLEKEFAPTFTAEDLVNLGFAQIYLKLMIDGVSSQPFSARTMAPIPRPDVTFREQVIAISREQFAHPRAQVEEEIVKWHSEGNTAPAAPQSRDDFASGQRPREQYGKQGDRGGDRRQGYSTPRDNSRPYGNNDRNGQRFDRPPMAEQKPEVVIPPIIPEKPMSKPEPEKIVTVPEPEKADAHKMAFMKAAEMLKEREAITNPPIVPLSSLEINPDKNKDNKKVPTKENLSSLKDALAHVTKSATVVVPKKNPIIEKHDDVKVENVAPVAKTPIGDTIKTDKAPEKVVQKEVPENVLRDILKMDE